MLNKLQQRRLLFLVLLAAFFLRVWGVGFGLPLFYPHTDETFTVSKARGNYEFNAEKGEAMNIMHYFVRALDVFVVDNTIVKFDERRAGVVDKNNIILASRVVSALMSTANVLLIYLIVLQLFKKRRELALLTALFLAITFVDVQMAHYLRQDVYTHFLGILAIYFSTKYLVSSSTEAASNQKLYLALSGFLAGLAASVRLNGVLFLIPLGVLLFQRLILKLSKKDYSPTVVLEFSQNGLLVASTLVLGFVLSQIEFFISTPIRYWPVLVTAIMEIQKSAVYASAANGMSSFEFFTVYALKVGLYYPLFVASLIGAVFFAMSKYKHKLYLFSFPVAYFLIISARFTRFDRLLTAITPFLAFFAAFFIYKLLRWKKVVAISVLSLILVVSVVRVAVFDFSLTQKDTTELALEWIGQNVPRGTQIYFMGSANQIGAVARYMGYRPKMVFGLHKDPAMWKVNGLVVVSSRNTWTYENYKDTDEYRMAWEQHTEFLKRARLVAEFKNKYFDSELFGSSRLAASSTVKNYHNPTIWIYEVGE